MKVFTVFGTSKSGKTTTIEALIKELIRRGYSVGSVKDIHFERFAMDTPGSNTDRHRQSGANPVTALGLYETDVMFAGRLPLDEILSFYRQDYVILEGVRESGIPAILTVQSEEDADGQDTPFVFAISGVGAAQIKDYKGRPAIDATTDISALADLIEQKVFHRLPMTEKECCGLCGFDCETLGLRMLAGECSLDSCKLKKQVSLTINGRELEMVPFVQAVLKNAVLGVAKELRGYEKGRIQMEFIDE
jgi:molybdopterin-guanine dinucleotide biosynthesis protein B